VNNFLGFLPVSVGCTFALGLVNYASGAPANPDANPVYRIYGQTGLVAAGNGSLTPFESGTITAASNANPIVLTTGAVNSLTSGTAVRIASVGGNTNANGLNVVTVLTTQTFSIPVAGNAPYTSGGTWKTAGLYLLDLTVVTVPSLVSAFEEGLNYAVDVNWTESTVPKIATFQFAVG
jgi:hypothetical protein